LTSPSVLVSCPSFRAASTTQYFFFPPLGSPGMGLVDTAFFDLPPPDQAPPFSDSPFEPLPGFLLGGFHLLEVASSFALLVWLFFFLFSCSFCQVLRPGVASHFFFFPFEFPAVGAFFPFCTLNCAPLPSGCNTCRDNTTLQFPLLPRLSFRKKPAPSSVRTTRLTTAFSLSFSSVHQRQALGPGMFFVICRLKPFCQFFRFSPSPFDSLDFLEQI